jgi:hypothetical protein
MRKPIVAAVACLAVGDSGAAFAHSGQLSLEGGGAGSGTAAGRSAAGQQVGGPPAVAGGRHDLTFGMTTIGNTAGIGTETIDGQAAVGTTRGQSGSTSGLAPVIAGRNVNVLLGPDRGTTSKREACPGWTTASGRRTGCRGLAPSRSGTSSGIGPRAGRA